MRESALAAVVLAAGRGKRMRSPVAKVLHAIAGEPMVTHVVAAVRRAGAKRIVCVVGHQGDDVRRLFANEADVEFANQPEPLGTGHAVACAAPRLGNFEGDVLICCGDTPLLTADTLRALVGEHRDGGFPATVLAARIDDPTGYGRILVDDRGYVIGIVEEGDATEKTRRIDLVNTGVYCVVWSQIRPLLEALPTDNVQGEQYLTDIMRELARRGTPGGMLVTDRWEEVQGVNDPAQLAAADRAFRDRSSSRESE